MPDQPRPGDQPLPIPNDGPGMHDLVIADWREKDGTIWPSIIREMEARRDVGLERYGQPLQANNGRVALRDLIEELLDAAVYARQVHEEATEGEIVVVADLIASSIDTAISLTQLLRTLAGAVYPWPVTA